MTTCPTCRGKFIPTRNLVLEKMASRAKRPCLNVSYGCTEKFTLDVMEQHDRVCPYRMYDCVQTNCKWQGIRSFIKQHFKEKHPESMFELKNELNLSYKKISLENDCSFNYLFFKSDELFWYRSVRDSDKKTLSEVVQYIGPKENACKYVYEIVITTKARDQTVRVANVVRSDIEDLATIFEARNCFVMDFGMLKKFIVDGCYSYKIKMTKS
ncbi:hypothetical protein C0J52_24375 [Blattella germanica]|nr:hypothetical protein C0J52_24375 [Blattella germanica]